MQSNQSPVMQRDEIIRPVLQPHPISLIADLKVLPHSVFLLHNRLSEEPQGCISSKTPESLPCGKFYGLQYCALCNGLGVSDILPL